MITESALKPRLKIQTEQGIECLELPRESTWTFGRSAQNSVPLSDPFASRYHAKLEVNHSLCCCFVDLKSRNGTLLNDHPLTSPVWLKHGDRISIGETTITFEFESVLEFPPEVAPIVFMVQGLTIQGEIWREIFHHLSIPIVWESSSATLKQNFEQRSLSQTLPKFLLLDVQVHNNAYLFCRWCHQNFPQVQIFLLDSLRKEVSPVERRVALKSGALNLFPAMNRRSLVLRSAETLTEINEVLQKVGNDLLSKEEFLPILQRVYERMDNVIGADDELERMSRF
jgi:pSer/pThr/pTyr-binding forkhead associated (FHA) protein